jgi:hypothetical protein
MLKNCIKQGERKEGYCKKPCLSLAACHCSPDEKQQEARYNPSTLPPSQHIQINGRVSHREPLPSLLQERDEYIGERNNEQNQGQEHTSKGCT